MLQSLRLKHRSPSSAGLRASSPQQEAAKAPLYCQGYRHARVEKLVRKLAGKITAPYQLEVRSFEIEGRRFPVAGSFTPEIERAVVDAFSSFRGPALRDLEGKIEFDFMLREPIRLFLIPEARWKELANAFSYFTDESCVGTYFNRAIFMPLIAGRDLAKDLAHEIVHALLDCRFVYYDRYLDIVIPPPLAQAICDFRKRRKLAMTATNKKKVFSNYAYWDPIDIKGRRAYLEDLEDQRLEDAVLPREICRDFQNMGIQERKRQAYRWYVQSSVAEEYLTEAWAEYAQSPDRLHRYEPEFFLYVHFLHESIRLGRLKTWEEMEETARYLAPGFFHTAEGKKLVTQFN